MHLNIFEYDIDRCVSVCQVCNPPPIRLIQINDPFTPARGRAPAGGRVPPEHVHHERDNI